jgi:hypothetical protein
MLLAQIQTRQRNYKTIEGQRLKMTKTVNVELVPTSFRISFREDYDLNNLNRQFQQRLKLDVQFGGKRPELLDRFCEFCTALLDAYNSIPKSNQGLSFAGHNNYCPSYYDIQRIAIIKAFCQLAQSCGIDIDYYCTGDNPDNCQNICINCGNPNVDPADTSCGECGAVLSVLRNVRATKHDRNVSNTTPLSTSDQLTNHINAIDYYQGKIPITQHSQADLTELLDSAVIGMGLMSGEKMTQSQPLDERGRRRGTSVDLMIRGIQAAGLDCYDHINYICAFYWGWELPNIEHLRQQLISDYQITQATRSNLSINDRGTRSNIPKYLRLCWHLMKRGWPCQYSDFKLPKDIDKYANGWKEMCRLSGDPVLMQG